MGEKFIVGQRIYMIGDILYRSNLIDDTCKLRCWFGIANSPYWENHKKCRCRGELVMMQRSTTKALEAKGKRSAQHKIRKNAVEKPLKQRT